MINTFSFSSESSSSSSAHTGEDGCLYTKVSESNCQRNQDGTRSCKTLERFFRQCPGTCAEEKQPDGSWQKTEESAGTAHGLGGFFGGGMEPGFGSLFGNFGHRGGLLSRPPLERQADAFDDRRDHGASDFERRYERRYGGGGQSSFFGDNFAGGDEHRRDGAWSGDGGGGGAGGNRDDVEQTFRRMEEVQRELMQAAMRGDARLPRLGRRRRGGERRQRRGEDEVQ
eukprot:CAMPEP_0177713060 /NCGR_PEP_ID=MMETSP0484_2-20121128/12733_1 /TAXON_ID=354590 /ORGANISM="Rhodomonas lens, Strain RHODO" /LENGTH=226 /DNA_ID=CAMNT_0019224915 /DNA_START=109 /DNA_END=786 /DNA_ORIENTATION=-